MKVAFNGTDEQVVTFEADSGVTSGKTVKMSANGKVSPCADGDLFCGIAADVRGGFAGITIRGYCRASYTGTAPSVGYNSLCANAAGGVKTAGASAASRQILVTDVDAASSTVGILL